MTQRSPQYPAVLLAAALALVLAGAPAGVSAQDRPPAAPPEGSMGDGADLLERGARMLLRGLLSEVEPALRDMGEALSDLEPALRDLARMIGDIRNYHAPEMLPNGDIILRRKVPLLPVPPGEGEIEL